MKVRIDVCIIHLTTLDLQTKSANIALKITVFFFVDVLMIALAAEIELNNEVTLLGDSQLGEFSARGTTSTDFFRHQDTIRGSSSCRRN